MAIDGQDPVKAAKRQRWNELRRANRQLPADSITSMVEQEFRDERPAIDEPVAPSPIRRTVADVTAAIPSAVRPTMRVAQPPPESGVGIRGQSILSMIDAFNPFNDELAGLAGGVGSMLLDPRKGSFQRGYTETRDAARAPVKEFSYYNPELKLGGDIVASLITPPLFGPARAGTGPISRIFSAAGRGGAESALYGFGQAEGTPTKQLLQAGGAGVVGGITAAGLQSLFNIGLRDRPGDVLARTAKQQGDVPLETVLEGIGPKIDQDVLTPMVPWEPRPHTPPGQPLPPERLTAPPGRTASVTGTEALGRTGRTAAEQVARQGGVPGERIAKAAEDVAAGGKARIFDDVGKALKVAGDDPRKLLTEIRTAQKAVSEPNYAKAFGPSDNPTRVKVTDNIRTVMQDPAFRDAAEERRVFLNGRLNDRMEIPPLYDNAGNLVAEEIPLKLLDQVKQGMDQVARKKGQNAVALIGEEGKDVSDKLKLLRDEASLQVDDYRVARTEHKTFEDRAEWLKNGLDILKPTERIKGKPEIQTPVSLAKKAASAEALDAADGLNRAELYRVGVLYRIGQQVKRSGKLSPEHMARLEAVLPEGADVQMVAKGIEREGSRADLAKLLRRAITSPKGEGPGLTEAAANIGAGATRRGFAEVIHKVTGRNRDLPLTTRESLADLLAARGPELQAQVDATLAKRRRLGRSVGVASQGGRAASRALFDLLGSP